MISRRDEEIVVDTTMTRSNKEISHFFASRRAGEFWQASSLLVAHVLTVRIAPRALNLARIHSAKLILFGFRVLSPTIMNCKEKLTDILNKSETSHKQELLKFFDVLDDEYLREISEQNEKDPSFLRFLAENLVKKRAAHQAGSQAMWEETLKEEEKYLNQYA